MNPMWHRLPADEPARLQLSSVDINLIPPIITAMKFILRFASALFLIVSTAAAAEPLVRVDFTSPETIKQWRRGTDVGPLAPSSEGLIIPITGGDPNIIGPVMDLPTDQPLWLAMRYKSDEAGTLQIFFGNKGFSEDQSVRVGGKLGWNDVKIPLPPLGKGSRLRIDPPGAKGQAVLSFIEIDRRVPLKAPQWPKADDSPVDQTITSGDLELWHSRDRLGRFDVKVSGELMARSMGNLPIGYLSGQQQKWVDVHASKASIRVQNAGARLVVDPVPVKDQDGGTWSVQQTFVRGKVAGSIDVVTEIKVDQDRQITFLPLLMLSAGAGSFGEHKTQALFAGLEYLDKDEPSSSEADIIGAGSKRQVPDTLKITMPLMTVVAQERWVSLSWQMDPNIAAVFDSPDRMFHSGGTIMGLIAPGSNGANRDPDNILPHWPMPLKANNPIVLNATLLGGKGKNVTPSVSKHLAINPLPPLPLPPVDLKGYIKLAGAGWLDSKINDGDRFMHAWPGHFKSQPAADAAFFLKWLADAGAEPALAERAKKASEAAINQVNPAIYNLSSVGHVRWPVGSLIFGEVAKNVRHMRDAALNSLKRFEPDGSIKYQRTPEWDFGKTHFAPDANGLTSLAVEQVLVAATVSGDPKLKEEGLRLLKALEKFDDTVPRGAQTWEMPLHCPDIMACAHLVKCYTIGYELTGDEKLLARARYWAWTGVPFIYLRDPAGKPVGPYATTPCWGATHWRGVNWMGLPVQWCGLVYADSLYRFAQHDSQGPWKQLADGIVISGIQQTWPADVKDTCGLLPDSYMLREEKRNYAAINPGTVQANAGRIYGIGPMYDFRCVREKGWMIHAPGELRDVKSTSAGASVAVKPWTKNGYYVLIAGLQSKPAIWVNGAEVKEFEWQTEGWAIVKLKGEAAVEVRGPLPSAR